MLLLGEGESSTVSTKQGELRWQCLSSAGWDVAVESGGARGMSRGGRAQNPLYMCEILEGQIKMIILSFVKIIFTYFEVLN